jgi:putative DNA primase/helicase
VNESVLQEDVANYDHNGGRGTQMTFVAERTKRNMKEYLDGDQYGDGLLFADMFRDRVIYDKSMDKWFIWTGNYWEEDWNRQVWNMVANQVSAEYLHAAADAKANDNQDLYDAFRKRSRELQFKTRTESVLDWAWKQEGMHLKGNEWDANPMLLGVNNGVIDLTTGQLRETNPRDYLKAHSPTDWTGLDTPCPSWEQFMFEIMDCDVEMVNFLHRLLGYSITGDVSEDVFPIHQGGGRNGKTTLFEVIGEVLGKDYCLTSNVEALSISKRDGEAPNPFVRSLQGKRFVWASEGKDGLYLDAGLLKRLSGGDTIRARGLHENGVEWKPTHKVSILTNPKPHLPADDQAIWDRVFLVPYKLRFVDNPDKEKGEFQRNKDLPELLKQEASGILAWLVRGCLAWQAEGLNPPDKVKAATQEYQEQEDMIGDFVRDCLDLNMPIRSNVTQIYSKYKEWAQDEGIRFPLTKKKLSARLSLKFGHETTRNSDGYGWNGVCVHIPKPNTKSDTEDGEA